MKASDHSMWIVICLRIEGLVHVKMMCQVYWEALARDPSNKAEVSRTREWLDKMVKNKRIVSELREFPEPGTGADSDNRKTVGWYALISDDIGVEEAMCQPGIQLIKKSGILVDFGSTTAAI
jgi:hypothetical protein